MVISLYISTITDWVAFLHWRKGCHYIRFKKCHPIRDQSKEASEMLIAGLSEPADLLTCTFSRACRPSYNENSYPKKSHFFLSLITLVNDSIYTLQDIGTLKWSTPPDRFSSLDICSTRSHLPLIRCSAMSQLSSLRRYFFRYNAYVVYHMILNGAVRSQKFGRSLKLFWFVQVTWQYQLSKGLGFLDAADRKGKWTISLRWCVYFLYWWCEKLKRPWTC